MALLVVETTTIIKQPECTIVRITIVHSTCYATHSMRSAPFPLLGCYAVRWGICSIIHPAECKPDFFFAHEVILSMLKAVVHTSQKS